MAVIFSWYANKKTTYISVSRFAVRRGLDRRRRSEDTFKNKYHYHPRNPCLCEQRPASAVDDVRLVVAAAG